MREGVCCIDRWCGWTSAMSALDRLERLEKLQSRPQEKTGARKSRFTPRATRAGKERGWNTRDTQEEPTTSDVGDKNKRDDEIRESETVHNKEKKQRDVDVQTHSKTKKAAAKKDLGTKSTLTNAGKRKRNGAKESTQPRAASSSLTLREIIQRSNTVEKRKPNGDKNKSGKNTHPHHAQHQDKTTRKDKADTELAPQVAVVDGKIVVDEVSLRVEAAPARTTPLRRVEEAGTRLNAATYANRTAPEKWTAEDTSLFYRAIRQFGTDFSLIERLFPGRSRKQIKRKFKTEEALNPGKVEAALHPVGRNEADHYRAMIDMLKAAKEAKKKEEDGETNEPQEGNAEG